MVLINKGDNNLSSSFRIKLPNNSIKYLYYDKYSNREEILLNHCLLKWMNYCENNWLWFGKFDDNILTYEDKVKSFLDKCATFLLLKDSKKNNILTYKNDQTIYKNEINLSYACKNTNDLVYSNLRDYEEYDEDKIHEGEQKIDLKDNKLNNITKWDQKRIKKIYDKKGTLRNIKLKNVIKNTFYITKWCLVDTENKFKFNGNIYKIDEACKQYNVTIRKYDDYRKKKEIREDYDMFEILGYIPCRKEYIPRKLNNSKKEVIVNTPTLVQNAPIQFYDQDINNISEFVLQL